MQVNHHSARLISPLLAAVLLFVSASAQDVSQNASQATQSQQQSPAGGTTVDPSAGPLKPSTNPPTSVQPSPEQEPLPNAPQPAASTPPEPTQPAPRTAQEPLGTAAAEQIRTAGGAASRPAGNAIAPAKQHQYRSLVIKLGAVAAAGIAIGAVYGLSHGTSSTPPHSTTAAAK